MSRVNRMFLKGLPTHTLQIICIVALVLALGLLLHYHRIKQIEAFMNPVEGFVDSPTGIREQVHRKGADQIYDEFYADVYDQLFQSDTKNEYECLQIHKNYLKDWKTSKVRLLDAGCGTGLHARIMYRYGHHVEGIDQSNHMVRKAKQNCPKGKFMVGDFLDGDRYPTRHFTHILCLFFTVYSTPDAQLMFRNFNKWLEPKGYVFVHAVNPKRFDPVLERASSLIPFFDPQRHSDKRQTRTTLAFREFTYESDWDLTDMKNSTFTEHFLFKDEPYDRHHVHEMSFMTPKKIITIANKNGFELIKAIDMFLVGYNFNYIMCFRKKFGD